MAESLEALPAEEPVFWNQRPAPEEMHIGGVRYVRGDLYDQVKLAAEMNKETIEKMVAEKNALGLMLLNAQRTGV